MSEVEDQGQEALWAAMRGMEPPMGAAQRVRRAVEAQAKQPTRRRSPWIALVPVAAAAAAAVVLFARTGDGDGAGEGPSLAVVAEASGVTVGEATLSAGSSAGREPIVVAEGGHLRLTTRAGAIDSQGPARLRVSDEQVVVLAGTAELRGVFDLGGGECLASVDGQVRATAEGEGLTIVILSGRATATKGSLGCRIENPKAAPAQDPELTAQTREYWAAMESRDTDPAVTLERLEAFESRWPESPLLHEAGLGIIDALVRLRREDDARARASEFLQRFPDSPRRADVEAIAESR